MKAAEAIVKILEKEGITHAFGIPGAGINPVYKFLGHSKSILHFTMRHEEAAVHAADGFFRASGKMAAALCTSGPGATNFVTGIYTAWIDSVPLIALTGQNVTSLLGKDAFQCVDIAAICKPIAKATYCITSAAEVVNTLRQAFHTARSGKPGPVVIDLPLDVQMAEVDFSIDQYSQLPVEVVMPEAGVVAKAVDLLLSAKNPVIILGGGAVLSGAVDECRQFAELTNIPVITTYMAKGALHVDHPLNVGSMGVQVGNPLGNKIFLESDVVLGIGCRFTDRHTGDIKVYQGDRKFIHINIEAREIGKIIKTEVGIVADAKMAVKALTENIKSRQVPAPSARVKDIPRLKKELKRKTYFDAKPIKPQRVFHEINDFFTQDTIFTTGCGLNQIWSGQFQEINKPRLYLPSGGAGTLGFDIPAAFGAKLSQPHLPSVAVMGDFGFTFLVEELAVAAAHEVPIIVIILNNAYLSLIRQNQKYAYQYEYAVKMPENHSLIDYVKVSEGFGCQSERVTDPSDIRGALERAVKSKKPYVIDIIVEEETDCSMGPSIAAVKEFE